MTHFKDGESRTQSAKSLKMSRTRVNKWAQPFLEEGLEGLQEKREQGGPHSLLQSSSQWIKHRASDSSGRRLSGSDIHAYIIKEFGKHYHPSELNPIE
ncbi:transposase, partial [Vibrio ostreicida]